MNFSLIIFALMAIVSGSGMDRRFRPSRVNRWAKNEQTARLRMIKFNRLNDMFAAKNRW